jgi:hypothetical protein
MFYFECKHFQFMSSFCWNRTKVLTLNSIFHNKLWKRNIIVLLENFYHRKNTFLFFFKNMILTWKICFVAFGQTDWSKTKHTSSKKLLLTMFYVQMHSNHKDCTNNFFFISSIHIVLQTFLAFEFGFIRGEKFRFYC